MTEREVLIEDYETEIEYGKEMKKNGILLVDPATAGTEDPQPIDEYIKRWEDGLTALKNGDDVEKYRY